MCRYLYPQMCTNNQAEIIINHTSLYSPDDALILKYIQRFSECLFVVGYQIFPSWVLSTLFHLPPSSTSINFRNRFLQVFGFTPDFSRIGLHLWWFASLIPDSNKYKKQGGPLTLRKFACRPSYRNGCAELNFYMPRFYWYSNQGLRGAFLNPTSQQKEPFLSVGLWERILLFIRLIIGGH